VDTVQQHLRVQQRMPNGHASSNYRIDNGHVSFKRKQLPM
jgi:hypothetical protein